MARRSSAITQADIAKLIRAAIAAGVGREHIVVKLNRDGATMRFSDPNGQSDQTELLPLVETATDDSWSDVDGS